MLILRTICLAANALIMVLLLKEDVFDILKSDSVKMVSLLFLIVSGARKKIEGITSLLSRQYYLSMILNSVLSNDRLFTIHV